VTSKAGAAARRAPRRYVEWLAALDHLGSELPANTTLYLGRGALVGR
jgi:hypothetical protein